MSITLNGHETKCQNCGIVFVAEDFEAQHSWAMSHVCKPRMVGLSEQLANSKCRATGLLVNGEMSPECTLRHGHAGVCNWTAMKITDDQLRAEYERRGLDLEDFEYAFTCHGCGGTWSEFDTEAERDAADAKHDAECPRGLGALTRERDEWKRRADAAEKELAERRYMRGLQTYDEPAQLERGPGIASLRTDNEGHYVDPWDFLEDA